MAYDMAKLERMGKSMARSAQMQKTAEGIRDDYAATLKDLTGDVLEQAKPAIHLRSAKKLLDLAKEYGGIFNKAAQFAASLRGPIPKEYTDTLSELTDKAPFKPFAEIDKTIIASFGKSAKELFAEFEETPMAAASLAQVHRAKLQDGKTVAVKIQYPGLAEQIEADLEVIETMMKMFADKLPFDMTWLLNDFRGYLRKEVNFQGEAANCTRVAQDFAYNNRIYVPQCIQEYCTESVLTLDFAEGCARVNDLKFLKLHGFDPLQVADLLNEISTTMVLITGFVHGDPHAGNVYVRAHPDMEGPQIVILDHGLYHELPEDVRTSLCELWKSSIIGPPETKKKLCEKFAGPMAHFFPLCLSQWFLDNISIEEAADLAAGRFYQNVDLQEIAKFLGGMEEQKAILGMLHSTGYTRFLLQDLGIPEIRRLKAWGQAALAGTDPKVLQALRGAKEPEAQNRLKKYEAQVSSALDKKYLNIRWFAFCFIVWSNRQIWVLTLIPVVAAIIFYIALAK